MIKDKRPRYVVIMENVQQMIKDKSLKSKDKLPTEPELMKEYGVSRATVRQAMQELENDGIIEKIHGVGTFVAERKMKIQMQGFFSFSEEVKNNPGKYHTEVLSFKKTTPVSKVIYEALECAECELIEIKRLRSIDGEPVLLEITYIPATLYPGKLPRTFQFESIYDFIRSLGIKKLKGIEKLVPYHPSAEEAKYLQVDKKTDLLKFTRLLKDKQPVEYSVSILKPGKISIQTQIERTL